MSEPFIVMKPSELRKMMIDTFKEVLKDTEEPKPKEKEETIPMPELVKSRRYGCRNTVARYRNEIMAEDDNQSIVVKRGRRYYFDPVKFDDWFMKRKKINAEKLKVDPRRRQLMAKIVFFTAVTIAMLIVLINSFHQEEVKKHD